MSTNDVARSTERGQRRVSAKWRLLGLGVVLILAVASWGVWRAATSSGDPRAYPGSKIESLNEALDHYHLRLPECAQNSIRFGQYGQFRALTFYAYFAGNRECVREFLTVNGLDGEDIGPEEGLPFQPAFGSEFGWPHGEKREYQVLGGTLHEPGKDSVVDVLIAIDESSSKNEVYLRASTL